LPAAQFRAASVTAADRVAERHARYRWRRALPYPLPPIPSRVGLHAHTLVQLGARALGVRARGSPACLAKSFQIAQRRRWTFVGGGLIGSSLWLRQQQAER
jgi:hypothetical protein